MAATQHLTPSDQEQLDYATTALDLVRDVVCVLVRERDRCEKATVDEVLDQLADAEWRIASVRHELEGLYAARGAPEAA